MAVTDGKVAVDLRVPCRGCDGKDTANILEARCYNCRQEAENKLAESEAARLKAEGERDELSMLHAALVTIKSEQDRDVADLESRLRAVIEAADRLLTTLEPRFTPGDERQRDAIVAYRRIRDAQPPASHEPEASPRVHEFAGPDIHHDFQHNHSPTVSIREKCLVCGFTPQAHLCWSCGLPWSQHGEGR